jgi:Protein kinase domain
MVRPYSQESLHDATTGPRVPWLPQRAPSPPAPAGIELTGYRDFVAIARSNVSEVYRAIQVGVERPVAVKVLLQLDDPEAVARFERELDITVQLGRQHPNIITVIDTGISSAGQPCIVMEYYDRGSLYDRLKAHGPLPVSDALAAGIAVADALAFAHGHGVLHRDVKPQNVLVLPTSYVVADFGIARRIDAARTTSVEWFSFRHAAPQVLDGDPPSVADDIWSVGSTLFTLLEGRSPFAADSPDEDTALAYMKRVRTTRPRSIERADVPRGMIAIIDRCLRYDPAERFPTADALLGALQDLAAERRAWAPDRAVTGETGVPTQPPPSWLPGGDGPSGPSGERGRPAPVGPAPYGPAAPGAMVPRPTAGSGAASGRDRRQPNGRVTGPPRPGTPGAEVAPPPRPATLAPSALMHLPPSREASAGPDRPTGTGPYGRELMLEPTGTTPTRRPRRRILLLAAAGLLLGAIVAVGGSWLSAQLRGTPNDQAGQVLPTMGPDATNVPSGAATYQVNPAIAPTITHVEADATSAFVQWQDPTGGEAAFYVVRLDGSQGTVIATPEAGTTELLIDGLEPADSPYCFSVVSLTADERGVSATVCAPET